MTDRRLWKTREQVIAEDRRAQFLVQLERWHGILFSPSDLIPKGMQVLLNKGNPVVCVPLGAPIEDAECDHIQLHPDDYERLLTSSASKEG
jgi:hypothetical protein